VAVAETGTLPHTVPLTVTLNTTPPLPDAEYVHTKLPTPPGGTVAGPERPLATVTAPGPLIASAGANPVTGVPPVLVTVRTTANHWPTDTVAGAAAPQVNAPGRATLFTEDSVWKTVLWPVSVADARLATVAPADSVEDTCT
jgi:hypothetical protein